jgi:hypothetical protein
MSDAHKVKHLLLTWLFEFGHNVVSESKVLDFLDYSYVKQKGVVASEMDGTLDKCCDAKYIWRIETAKGYEHLAPTRYKLLDDGVKFLNKGENNEQ